MLGHCVLVGALATVVLVLLPASAAGGAATLARLQEAGCRAASATPDDSRSLLIQLQVNATGPRISPWHPEDAATQGAEDQPVAPPFIFAAVLTAPSYHGRRQAVRESWKLPPEVRRRFILCVDGNISNKLQLESDAQRDLLFLPCVEQYTQGFLTRKVATVMRFFLDNYPHTQYFFKTDDDTLADLHKLGALLVQNPSRFVYAGHFEKRRYQPIRNPKSMFYEPFSVYRNEWYPPGAPGGPGYVLSQPLIRQMFDSNIVDANMLWNEDRAVSVWVAHVSESGCCSVLRLEISGENGYNHNLQCMRWKDVTWAEHSHVILHHKLEPASMRCVAKHVQSNNNKIADCLCDAALDNTSAVAELDSEAGNFQDLSG